MRVSFDLDDTLICIDPAVPREPMRFRWILGLFFREPLRSRTRELIKELKGRGCRVNIYTTSYRSPRMVRLWLLAYGITVDRVITQAEHDALRGDYPSKYPPAFGFDLHIDNERGVGMEGAQHGYAVVVVAPEDADWTRKVLAAEEKMGGRK